MNRLERYFLRDCCLWNRPPKEEDGFGVKRTLGRFYHDRGRSNEFFIL
jgi:hypothetical protein